MHGTADQPQHDDLGPRVIDLTIRLLLVVGLVYWCFLLFQPFILLLVWGVVLAIAFSPLFDRTESLLGGRRKLAGVLFIVVGLGILAVPALLLADSFVEGLKWLSAQEEQGAVVIPPPPENVADWPVIGERLSGLWSGASSNLEETAQRYEPQLRGLATWLLSKLTGFGAALLLTMVSVVIAGVVLINADAGVAAMRRLGGRVAGERGEDAVTLAGQAVRSVAYGVVGVAAIQATLSAVGLFFAGVPAAGLLAGIVLILAVAQLPPLLVLGPAIVYVIATSDNTLVIVLFSIWSVVVSFSDAILKPMLLGRGMDIPMPVILIGAIGGMIRGGIIGLFVGAAVMAIGYMMYKAWLHRDEPRAEPAAA